MTAGYISLATFPNQAGLQRAAARTGRHRRTPAPRPSGQPGTAGFSQTISGELEQSNVDMATEFTNMIEAERGYQANSSVITTADQMIQTLVQMGSDPRPTGRAEGRQSRDAAPPSAVPAGQLSKDRGTEQ